TKLVLAISGMVMLLVATLSSIYITQIVHQRVNSEYQNGDFVASEILHAAQDTLQLDLSNAHLDPSNAEAVRAAIEESLQTDAGLNTLLESIVGYSQII